MALFSRRQNAAAFASAPAPEVQAAAGSAGSQIGAFYNYSVGGDIERASSIPTLSRALNLLQSVICGLDLEQYIWQWTGTKYDMIEIQGESWMDRPDPRVPRSFFLGGLVADIFWRGRGFAYVTSRYSTGYPASFQWLPAANVNTPDQVGPYWFGPSEVIQFNGQDLDRNNVLEFLSPSPGALFTGARMMDIAIRLDTASKLFANTFASGWLRQTAGETLTQEELSDLAAAWAAARATGAIGALNDCVTFEEFTADPSKLQLTEGREYSSLELSRVANIPPFLLGISTGGMTYQNAQEAMRQLYLLGARPIMTCIEETFSLDTVIPRGRHVRFDVDTILQEAALVDQQPATDPSMEQ